MYVLDAVRQVIFYTMLQIRGCLWKSLFPAHLFISVGNSVNVIKWNFDLISMPNGMRMLVEFFRIAIYLIMEFESYKYN